MPRDPRPAPASAPAATADDIAALPNLGPRTRAMLAAAGIRSVAQLRRAGAVAAYVKLKRRGGSGASLNALYALAAALDGCDWRRVQRERRLELLTAVEDYERRHPARPVRAAGDELLALRNIGPAMRRDFELLGIRSRAQLARRSADALYARIQRLTGTRHDPCVWDTYAAAIHQAKTGEALAWWQFTPERRRRQQEGSFVAVPRPAAAGPPRRRRPPG